jgi:hypothetical protein
MSDDKLKQEREQRNVVVCDCGDEIKPSNMIRHLNSIRHSKETQRLDKMIKIIDKYNLDKNDLKKN